MGSNYDDWSDDQKAAMGRVAGAIVDGDLQPLADYFRAGYLEIESSLALELADMIDDQEGFTPFRLKAVGRSKRPGGWSTWMELHDRKMAIGVYIERELKRSPRGSYEGVIQDACDQFGVSDKTAERALSYVRKHMKNSVSVDGFDQLEHLWSRYSSRDA